VELFYLLFCRLKPGSVAFLIGERSLIACLRSTVIKAGSLAIVGVKKF